MKNTINNLSSVIMGHLLYPVIISIFIYTLVSKSKTEYILPLMDV